ncbi:MAG: hypothetical protein K0U41_09115 [Gammaproteobacteria bacterium]|nr:hypothetical protein [Gammaproteobacteria bacterium]
MKPNEIITLAKSNRWEPEPALVFGERIIAIQDKDNYGPLAANVNAYTAKGKSILSHDLPFKLAKVLESMNHVIVLNCYLVHRNVWTQADVKTHVEGATDGGVLFINDNMSITIADWHYLSSFKKSGITATYEARRQILEQKAGPTIKYLEWQESINILGVKL